MKLKNKNLTPIYNIHKSYLENLEQGPFFQETIPVRCFPAKEEWKDFLGFPVASTIGVPAGPLLNAKWVTFAAEMGFDIVTYKTIRSRAHPAHPLPNMIYVDTNGPLTKERAEETLLQTSMPPNRLADLAVTNSFGIPSRDAEFLIKDIKLANSSLAPGQVMIVSIVGTPRPNEDFIGDFASCASIALEGGSRIIEADLSCPNVVTCEGSLYADSKSVFEISSRIKKTIGSVPLIIKIGVLDDENKFKEILLAAAKAGVQGVCGINTVSMKVVREDGSPALGKNREKAGVCGGPIRQAGLEYVKMAHKINKEEKLGLTIMATGGVTAPEHFDLFFEAGADVAMSAVGMMWDPYLAMRYHGQYL